MKDESTLSTYASEYDMDEEFDPLEDLEADEEDESEEIIGYVGTQEDAVVVEAKVDDRPAKERIDDLLTSMAPRRKVLLGTIAFCRDAQPVSAVNAFIDEMQEDNFSVFTPANLCALLEKAGALDRITVDGEAADEIEVEPEVVVIDGVEYLEAKTPVEMQWEATEEGLAAVEADKPFDRLHGLFEADELYLPIHKRILTLCSKEGGASVSQLNDAVDSDPLVQKPRLYAPHFIDKLEKCDALAWKKSWITTEIGEAGLDLLADIEDSATITTEEA